VSKLHKGLQGLVKSRNITYVEGAGKLISKNTVSVNGTNYTGKNVILATGSYPKTLPGLEIDGKQIVTVGADQALKLWNVETGEQVRTAQSAGKQITGVRWSATKPVITGSSGDKNVRLWNPENGQISKTLGGANDFLFSVAANKDATFIYSGGQNGVVHIWNAADGKLIKTLEFAPKTAGVAIRTP
jgi:WD40 repeat protein